jgi:hypothetical protein
VRLSVESVSVAAGLLASVLDDSCLPSIGLDGCAPVVVLEDCRAGSVRLESVAGRSWLPPMASSLRSSSSRLLSSSLLSLLLLLLLLLLLDGLLWMHHNGRPDMGGVMQEGVAHPARSVFVCV